MISAIVAVDNNWGIGFNGNLLEHLPPDMKYFKELTSNNWVVMGRKTWDSLPKKPLPNRQHLIITNDPLNYKNTEDVLFVKMGQAKLIMNQQKGLTFFVIGGGEVYKQLLPLCDRVYVTKILRNYKNIDTYFPNLDKDPKWEVSTCTELREYENIPYAFLTYDRIS